MGEKTRQGNTCLWICHLFSYSSFHPLIMADAGPPHSLSSCSPETLGIYLSASHNFTEEDSIAKLLEGKVNGAAFLKLTKADLQDLDIAVGPRVLLLDIIARGIPPVRPPCSSFWVVFSSELNPFLVSFPFFQPELLLIPEQPLFLPLLAPLPPEGLLTRDRRVVKGGAPLSLEDAANWRALATSGLREEAIAQVKGWLAGVKVPRGMPGIMCPFPNCRISGKKKSFLEEHILAMHVAAAELPCTRCPKRFATEKKLRRHEREVHHADLPATPTPTPGSSSSSPPAFDPSDVFEPTAPELLPAAFLSLPPIPEPVGPAQVPAVTLPEWARVVRLAPANLGAWTTQAVAREGYDLMFGFFDSLSIPTEFAAACPFSDCAYSSRNKGDLRDHVNLAHLRFPSHPCQHCGRSFFTHKKLQGHSKDHAVTSAPAEGEAGPGEEVPRVTPQTLPSDPVASLLGQLNSGLRQAHSFLVASSLGPTPAMQVTRLLERATEELQNAASFVSGKDSGQKTCLTLVPVAQDRLLRDAFLRHFVFGDERPQPRHETHNLPRLFRPAPQFKAMIKVGGADDFARRYALSTSLVHSSAYMHVSTMREVLEKLPALLRDTLGLAVPRLTEGQEVQVPIPQILEQHPLSSLRDVLRERFERLDSHVYENLPAAALLLTVVFEGPFPRLQRERLQVADVLGISEAMGAFEALARDVIQQADVICFLTPSQAPPTLDDYSTVEFAYRDQAKQGPHPRLLVVQGVPTGVPPLWPDFLTSSASLAFDARRPLLESRMPNSAAAHWRMASAFIYLALGPPTLAGGLVSAVCLPSYAFDRCRVGVVIARLAPVAAKILSSLLEVLWHLQQGVDTRRLRFPTPTPQVPSLDPEVAEAESRVAEVFDRDPPLPPPGTPLHYRFAWLQLRLSDCLEAALEVHTRHALARLLTYLAGVFFPHEPDPAAFAGTFFVERRLVDLATPAELGLTQPAPGNSGRPRHFSGEGARTAFEDFLLVASRILEQERIAVSSGLRAALPALLQELGALTVYVDGVREENTVVLNTLLRALRQPGQLLSSLYVHPVGTFYTLWKEITGQGVPKRDAPLKSVAGRLQQYIKELADGITPLLPLHLSANLTKSSFSEAQGMPVIRSGHLFFPP